MEESTLPIQADLDTPAGYKKIASEIFSLDAIVHCSGNSQYGLLVDFRLEEVGSLMRIHVINPIMLTKELLPKLTSKRSGQLL